MQIVTEKREVIASGMKAERQFTVKVGAHIMQVLSGLYAKPVDAMVREYLTNMHDANLALARKNPKAEILPAELSVPSSLSSELIFKDYGIGMSYETVWEVYAQYGNSTKADSNDEVGGFGLGSKTAFCYNNGSAWTIESRFEGQKHVFMAFVGEDGVPNLTHVSSKPTNEHSGVTIKIPIRREDIGQVTEAVQKYAPYFPSTLVLSGMPPVKTIVPILSGHGWNIGGRAIHRGVLRVIMGNVPYEIDSTQIRVGSYKTVDSYVLGTFLTSNDIQLDMPIGSVDIVPSRDNLKYTDRTKSAIKGALLRLLDELPHVVSKQMIGCVSEWDALVFYRSLTSIQYLQKIVTTILYKGETLDTNRGIIRKLKDLQKLDAKVQLQMIGVHEQGKSKISPLLDGVDKKGEPVLSTTMQLAPENHTYLVVDNIGKGALMATKALLYRDLVSKTISGRAASWGHKVGHAILLTTKLSNKQLSDFFGGFPVNNILMANDLKGIAVPAAIKKDNRDTIYRYSGRNTWDARVNIPDTEKKYYYLPLTQDKWSHRWCYAQKEVVQSLRGWATQTGLMPAAGSLYGIKTDEIKKFDKAVWVNLHDAMVQHAYTLAQKKPAIFAYRDMEIDTSTGGKALRQTITASGVEKLNHPSIVNYLHAVTTIESAKRDDQINNLMQFLHQNQTVKDRVDTIVAAAKVPAIDIVALEKKIYTHFPILHLLTDTVIYHTTGRYYASTNIDPFKKHQKLVLDFLKQTS